MADLLPITVADQIAELERELKMRRRVYPRHITSGMLTQDKADRQIAVLESAIATLRMLMPTGTLAL